MAMTRPIVELCPHGEAKPHKKYKGSPEFGSPWHYEDCPGGRVLEQAIIIEREPDGRWPMWAISTMYNVRDPQPSLPKALLDALASAQENQA